MFVEEAKQLASVVLRLSAGAKAQVFKQDYSIKMAIQMHVNSV